MEDIWDSSILLYWWCDSGCCFAWLYLSPWVSPCWWWEEFLSRAAPALPAATRPTSQSPARVRPTLKWTLILSRSAQPDSREISSSSGQYFIQETTDLVHIPVWLTVSGGLVLLSPVIYFLYDRFCKPEDVNTSKFHLPLKSDGEFTLFSSYFSPQERLPAQRDPLPADGARLGARGIRLDIWSSADWEPELRPRQQHLLGGSFQKRGIIDLKNWLFFSSLSLRWSFWMVWWMFGFVLKSVSSCTGLSSRRNKTRQFTQQNCVVYWNLILKLFKLFGNIFQDCLLQ